MAKPKQTSAAYRLFKFKYSVLMPAIFRYSNHYLEKHGYPVTGDGRLDDERLMELTTVRLCPAGMAMQMARGAYIDFHHADDAVKVYRDIREHLTDWERHIQQGAHPESIPPLEDFYQLEDLAAALYQTAMHYDPSDWTDSPLTDAIRTMNRARNPANADRLNRLRVKDEEGELKPYEPIAPRLEELTAGAFQWL